ncbi:MAG: hypothetical protein GX587_07010 [Bacteroidales bacterium]|nr:hypothetical protein [Bacteroidales bacterium]
MSWFLSLNKTGNNGFYHLMGNTFSKEERLCSHSAIEELFERGSIQYFHPLKVYYLEPLCSFKHNDKNERQSDSENTFSNTPINQKPLVKVLFSAPKKNFRHSVDRNRLKRQMKEAYRQNKILFEQKHILKENNLYIAFVYTSKKMIPFSHIEESIKKSILKICETLNGVNNGV